MRRNPNVKWLIILMLICGLTGLLTPIGSTPYTYLYKTMTGNTVNNINEHLPLTLAENIPDMCAIVILLAVMTFTKAKIRLSDLFMIGGLTYLLFSSRRQVTMFALIGSIILNRMIVEIIEIYGVCKIEQITKKFVNVISVAVVTVVLVLFSLDYIKDKTNDSFVNTKTYPVKAADWILENLDVNNIKLFNEYNYGSYLLYRGIPVFIDSRADLYSPEFNKTDQNEGQDIFMDFINTSNISRYYGSVFKKYGITHVIVYKNSKIKMLIEKADSEKYKQIYPNDETNKNDNFVIYEVIN